MGPKLVTGLGSHDIQNKKGDFVCHDGFRISNIPYTECKNCGEKFYDKTASRAIDQVLYGAGRLNVPEDLKLAANA